MTLNEAYNTLMALRDATLWELRLSHLPTGWAVEVLEEGRWMPMTEQAIQYVLSNEN